MTEPDASARVRAALPRGFVDRDPADIAAAEAMMAKIREVYALYGFEAVETPFVEYTEALGKFLPDQDRPNEGVFSFKDDDEQWLSLRYDLTAPLARYVAETLRPAAEALSLLSRGLGVPQREARARAATASSCSSTPTRSARPRRPRTPRSA